MRRTIKNTPGRRCRLLAMICDSCYDYVCIVLGAALLVSLLAVSMIASVCARLHIPAPCSEWSSQLQIQTLYSRLYYVYKGIQSSRRLCITDNNAILVALM